MTISPVEPLPHADAGIATAEDGFVILDGPNGVAVTMTADAASQTGHNLIDAARIARLQTSARLSLQDDDLDT